MTKVTKIHDFVYPFGPSEAFFSCIHNISVAKKFQILIFLAIKFPLMTNSIPWPLVAKIVIKGDWFWCLWRAKVQNIYLKSEALRCL